MTTIKQEEAIEATIEFTKTYELSDDEVADFKLMTNAERDEFLMGREPSNESEEVLDLHETVSLKFSGF